MEENPRPLADVPDDFAAIVMRCLEKDPARRFGSVGELSAALRPFGTEESDTALFAGDPTDLVGATPMPSTSTVTLRKTPFIDAVPTVKGKKRPEDERGLEPTIQADVPIADTALRTNARPGLHADSRESAATIAKTAAFGLAGDTPTTDRTSAESAAITTANAEAARGSAPTLVGLGSPQTMPVQRESGLELPSGVVDAATDPRSVRVWVVVGAAAVVLTLVIAWRFSMSTDSTAAPAAQSVEVSAPVPAPAPPIPAPSVAEPAPAPAVEPVPEPAPQPTPKAAAAAPVEEEPVSTTPPAQAAGDSKKRPRGRRPTPTQSSTGAEGGSVTPPSDKEIGKSRI